MGGALLSRGYRPGAELRAGLPRLQCPFTPTHRRPLLAPHLPATEDRKQVKKERPHLSCSIISSHTYCLRATCESCVFTVFFLKVLTHRLRTVITITENSPLASLLAQLSFGNAAGLCQKPFLWGGVTHLEIFHRGSHSTREP